MLIGAFRILALVDCFKPETGRRPRGNFLELSHLKTMKAKYALAAAAAVGGAFLGRRRRIIKVREFAFDCKCLREAIETMEGEGGPVTS
jgi:hypothetical protein